MRKLQFGCTLAILIGAALYAHAQQDDTATTKDETPAGEKPAAADQEAMHDELRGVRDKIVDAVNKQDIDALLSHLHDNVVVVWQDGTISRGHDGVRKYYEEKLGGPNAVLDSYTVEPQITELTILHGDDTGISFGSILCHFKFKNGRQFDLNGPFSATLVRQDGDWKIAGFHASAGLFDNPILVSTQQMLVWGCAGAGVGGLVLGAVIVGILKRRKKV